MATPSDLTVDRPLVDQEIRLLRLNPSPAGVDSSKPLECTIEYHPLTQAPPYIALSYCWGSSSLKLPLIIDGKPCGVGANAVSALLHLLPQNDSEIHHFWVDQLCINQDDNAEKSRQVTLMWQIYSLADRVIAWIGLPGEDDVEFIIHHMKQVAELLRKGDAAKVVEMHSDAALLLRAAHALRAFCKRQYWRRLWIVQEFSVARDAWITCGHAQLEYADMPGYLKTRVEMMRAFRTGANSFLEGVLTRRRRYHLRRMHATGEPSSAVIAGRPLAPWERDIATQQETLLRVLVVTLVLEVDHSQPEATNPLDRIFSVMQFADDKNEFVGFPEYGRKCEEVYQDAARCMLMQGHVDVLCYCQSPGEVEGLATWAPDWREPIKRPSINIWTDNLFCASGDTRKGQAVTAPDDKTVILRGVMVDRIKETGSEWDPDWTAKLDCSAALAYLEEVKQFCAASSRYVHTQPAGDDGGDGGVGIDVEVLRTAIADRYNYREEERHPELLEGYRAAVEYMKAIASGTNPHEIYGMVVDDEIGWQAPWFTFCVKNLHSRRPFLSETGFVGLVPMSAQPGDQVVIFLGGRAAYVIRRANVAEETWILVGECFAHGIMYGEFMEGKPEVRDFRLR
ncbi:heterokaryon incompatibility protein-domain-containing protein [Immersiella caudata]|uniref:Heterokaryon incompatibility protein-domain-containing protein n=1 Tax=Immersiella caudata TaxID=314043 RepID=A0AA40BUV1_9PEZI|nr:heterokaryon incompatibility protein-domain-containing protein [Immersiella caudata]